jgi:hypothetical protein
VARHSCAAPAQGQRVSAVRPVSELIPDALTLNDALFGAAETFGQNRCIAQRVGK